jgi:hypothetical protein
MTKRIRLTAIEIDAILSVAGAADAPAVFEDHPDNKEAEQLLEAFESGMEKLRVLLAKRGRHEP